MQDNIPLELLADIQDACSANGYIITSLNSIPNGRKQPVTLQLTVKQAKTDNRVIQGDGSEPRARISNQVHTKGGMLPSGSGRNTQEADNKKEGPSRTTQPSPEQVNK